MCKWNHKHVFFLGLYSPIELKEFFASKTLNIELHDCDEERENSGDKLPFPKRVPKGEGEGEEA